MTEVEQRGNWVNVTPASDEDEVELLMRYDALYGLDTLNRQGRDLLLTPAQLRVILPEIPAP